MKVGDLIGYNDGLCDFVIVYGGEIKHFFPTVNNFEEFLIEPIAKKEVASYKVVDCNKIVINC